MYFSRLHPCVRNCLFYSISHVCSPSSVFAALGLCHQDPDHILDPWASQEPAGQDAQRKTPHPGDDVRGRAGEAAEGEEREDEERQEPSQGMAMSWQQPEVQKKVLHVTCTFYPFLNL